MFSCANYNSDNNLSQSYPIWFIRTWKGQKLKLEEPTMYPSYSFSFYNIMLKNAKANKFCGDTIFFIYTKNKAILLQRDETRRMCGSNTRATVLDWLVGDGEFAQVVSAHLRLWREEPC